MKFRPVVSCFFLLFATASVRAEEHPLERDLRYLGEQLQAEKKQLRKLLDSSKAILKTLGEVESNIKELEEKTRQSQIRLEELKGKLEANAHRRLELEQRLTASRRILAAWLRQSYKAQRPFFETLQESRRLGDVLERLRWQIGVAHRQAELVQRIRTMQLELQGEKRRLEELAAEEKQLVEELQRRRMTLETTRRLRMNMLELVRKEASLHKKAMNEMERARRQLAELLARLEGKTTSSQGFATWQGRLPSPVKGAKIEVPFGIVEDEVFRTRTKHTGVDLRAEPGSSVCAVYPGTVVFADWMDGYGLMVILDHGGGYFTLYAHLDNLAVKKGDKVTAGSELGRLGDSGSIKGHYLYFEVREKGRAVDPQQWIKW